MTQEYYIITGKQQKGPYDLVMLVRKIRNGSLTATSMVQEGMSGATKPATEWPELKEFFGERKDDHADNSGKQQTRHRSLSMTLQNGWRFLQRNQISTVFSGFYVLLIILLVAIVHLGLPHAIHIIGYLISFVFLHFLMSCYLLSVLRMTRGQPTDMLYFAEKVFPALKSMLLSSLFTSLPAIIGILLLINSSTWQLSILGLFILAIPGLFVLSLYSFTPLVIVDQGYDFRDAMEISRKAAIKNGMENLGVIFALYVINFLAGLCVLLPLAITLPITMSALAEIYDESY